MLHMIDASLNIQLHSFWLVLSNAVMHWFILLYLNAHRFNFFAKRSALCTEGAASLKEGVPEH